MSAMVKRSDVVDAGMMPRSFDDVARMSKALAQARGFVPAAYIGNAPAIAAAIMTGLEIGIGPMQALREIHVIEGRPTLSATMMLALAIRAGVRHQWLRADAEEATIRLTREGFEPHTQTFTMADAKRAGLAGRGNWSKHPAAMLRARAISTAMRAFCPDVLGGSVYVEGEIEPARAIDAPVSPDEEPEIVDAPPLDAQLASAEASCAAPAEPAATPEPEPDEEPPAAPAQLTQCTTRAQLEAWCRTRGLAAMATHGERVVSESRKRARALGVSEDDAIRWLGLEPEAA